MIKWYKGITEEDFTDAVNYAVVNALKDGVNECTSEYKDYVRAHLKFWAETGLSAPKSEINSIQAWLYFTSGHTLEEVQDTMRARLSLLMEAAEEVYAGGAEAEDAVGIYDNRPDMDRGR